MALVALACAAVTVGVYVGQGSDNQSAGLNEALGLDGRAPTRHFRMDIVHDLGLNAGDEVHRASVTDPQVIARVADLLDHLGPMPKGPIACPNDDGQAFRLTFTSGGAPAAKATVSVTGCPTASVSIRGHQPRVYQSTQELSRLLTRLDP